MEIWHDQSERSLDPLENGTDHAELC